MQGRHSSILVAIGLAASAPAFGDEAKGPAFTPREMAHCMMKRLRANNAMTYREAYKGCKDQFDTARSNERVSDTAMNPDVRPQIPRR